jgi:hypothetical protein
MRIKGATMKTNKGTHRHDFDPLLVLDYLQEEMLPEEEAKRILDDACHVIMGLRKDLGDLLTLLEGQVKTRQYWITGKVDY